MTEENQSKGQDFRLAIKIVQAARQIAKTRFYQLTHAVMCETRHCLKKIVQAGPPCSKGTKAVCLRLNNSLPMLSAF